MLLKPFEGSHAWEGIANVYVCMQNFGRNGSELPAASPCTFAQLVFLGELKLSFVGFKEINCFRPFVAFKFLFLCLSHSVYLTLI